MCVSHGQVGWCFLLRFVKAKSHISLLESFAKKTTDFDVRLSLHLFDSLIKPILKYSCEILSQLIPSQLNLLRKRKHNQSNLFESYNNEIEQKKLKFCKTSLGLGKKSQQCGNVRRIRKDPLKSFCYVQQLKFLYQLSHIEKSTLVYKVYLGAFSKLFIASVRRQFIEMPLYI